MILALTISYIIPFSYVYLCSINHTVCTDRNRPNTATSFESMLSLKSIGMKSPFPGFELDENICGEAVHKKVFNSIVRNEGVNTTVTSPMTCTPPDVTNTNTHDFANALEQHTAALEANNNAVQELVQSVAGLTVAMNCMNDKAKFGGTCATIKAHKKRLKGTRIMCLST